jgi:hypothetical protein
MVTFSSIKNMLKILVLGLLLNCCVKNADLYKPAGVFIKEDSSFFTSSFETETGGSITNHIYLGESSIELVDRAKLRCTKINTEYKPDNFRIVFNGNLITNQMSLFEYDCK